MHSEFTIRAADMEDLRVLVDFNCRLAEETEGKMLDRLTVEHGVAAALERPELARYFVAQTTAQVVGQLMITLEWSDWRNGHFWWIQSVYVDPAFRRRGIFRALMRHVQQLARSLPQVCGLRLYVEEHNQAAMATYRELGMQASGHLVYEVDWSTG